MKVKKSCRNFITSLTDLRKKGFNLSENEQDAIRGFIFSEVISPRFVKKLVQEHGDKSISAAFLIPNNFNDYYLDYLLHRHKGDFYRKRYPGISFIQA
jgi:hypothetical protein